MIYISEFQVFVLALCEKDVASINGGQIGNSTEILFAKQDACMQILSCSSEMLAYLFRTELFPVTNLCSIH